MGDAGRRDEGFWYSLFRRIIIHCVNNFFLSHPYPAHSSSFHRSALFIFFLLLLLSYTTFTLLLEKTLLVKNLRINLELARQRCHHTSGVTLIFPRTSHTTDFPLSERVTNILEYKINRTIQNIHIHIYNFLYLNRLLLFLRFDQLRLRYSSPYFSLLYTFTHHISFSLFLSLSPSPTLARSLSFSLSLARSFFLAPLFQRFYVLLAQSFIVINRTSSSNLY